MGIKKFYNAISKASALNIDGTAFRVYSQKFPCNYFFFDFNTIIHTTSQSVINDLNHILFKIITNSLNLSEDSKAGKLISKYNLKLSDSISMTDYTKYLTEDFIDELIIKMVLEKTLWLLDKTIIEDIKMIYIAIDGVPSKGKMMEQKQRRYTRAFEELISEKIYQKHKNSLLKENQEFRVSLIENEIKWNKDNINPGTIFMLKLEKELKSETFRSTLQSLCPNLNEYIVSGQYEFGEAEFKIVNHMRNMKQEKAEYTFFSPDADVLLLCLLLNNSDINGKKLSRMTMFRQNQQKKLYDVVDIDRLSGNIYKYILGLLGSMVVEQDYVINDIVLLFNVYGNDFIHDVDSIDVTESLVEVFNIYAKILKDRGDHFVLFDKQKKKKRINIEFFVDILNAFQKREESYLRDKYLKDSYANYNKINAILGVKGKGNLNEVLGSFLNKARDFVEQIQKDDLSEVINRWKTDGSFFYKFRNFVKMGKKFSSNEEFIKIFAEDYKRRKRVPQMGVLFQKRSRTLNDSFHTNLLQKSLDNLEVGTRITPYDEELYKFKNMVDEYKDKMKQSTIDVGYIYISPDSFVFKTEDINKSIKVFYDDFFGIKDLDIKSKKIRDLVSSYIDGFVWCFEYYFNNYNIEEHHKLAHTWFFDYPRSPLLKQIYEFVLDVSREKDGKEYLEKAGEKLRKDFMVERKKFFSVLEQMMYVSPVQISQRNVPNEYKGFVKSNKYYVDLHKIADDFWKGTGEIIDCRGAIFMSQCHLKITGFSQSFEADQKFIQELRSIKLVESSSRDKKYSDDYEVETFKF